MPLARRALRASPRLVPDRGLLGLTAGSVLAAMLGWLALAGASPVSALLDVDPGPYRAAGAMGRVGTVEGRAAVEEWTAGRLSERALDGSRLVLVPRSEALLGRLRMLRERALGDPDAYRTSARALAEARDSAVQALADAGALDLVRRAVTGADGRFEFRAVPAGPWLLLGEHGTAVASPRRVGPQRPRRTPRLPPPAPLVGWEAVSVWLVEISVTAGATVEIRLADRNVWMTAIREERRPGPGR
jgi:hypothetical protein